MNLNEPSATVLSAVIAVLGVFVSLIVSIIIAKRTSYANNVTKERAIWLQHFREEISRLFAGVYATCKYFNMSEEETDCTLKAELIKIIAEAEGARTALITRLRTYPFKGNEFNENLKVALEKIDFYTQSTCGKELADRILPLCNYILEREWDKVKKE